MLETEEAEEIRRAAIESASFMVGLSSLLIAKGICTEEEIMSHQTAALAAMDQQLAALRDEG